MIFILVYTDLDDFVLESNGELTFTQLRATSCIDLTLSNDDVREFNETAVITPSPRSQQDIVLGGEFTVVIIDDGDGKLVFSRSVS